MEELTNSSLYKLNKKRVIYARLGFPFKKLKSFSFFDDCYSYMWKKKDDKEEKPSKEERLQSYLTAKKNKTVIVNEEPSKEQLPYFRPLVNVKLKLKQPLKILNRILSKSITTPPPYLQSFKGRSYATNALVHSNRYVCTLDVHHFFDSIKFDKVKSTFKQLLHIDNDVADFYAYICTVQPSPNNNNKNERQLGQGLPTSTILAFLCYWSLFDHIYDCATQLGLTMTLYVDDLSFSSDNKIPQKFIDRLFYLFKSNGLSLSRKKTRMFRPNSIKYVTGVPIVKGKPKIKFKKQESLITQYKYLCKNIKTISTIDQYLETLSVFMMFRGNYNHLIEVECKNQNRELKIKPGYKKFETLIKEYGKYFPNNIKLCNKNIGYIKTNISKDDCDKCNDFIGQLNSHKR